MSTQVRFFFFNDTATTEIYTLSLHDALPISVSDGAGEPPPADGAVYSIVIDPLAPAVTMLCAPGLAVHADRKSTRLNSSHANISYAVFCLKKKNNVDLPGLVPSRLLSATRSL